MYVAMILITLAATGITLAKIKVVEAIEVHLSKGSRHERKVQFFFNIVQKAFDPPPTSCGEFFKKRF